MPLSRFSDTVGARWLRSTLIRRILNPGKKSQIVRFY